mgnify:CR=1 FL=1
MSYVIGIDSGGTKTHGVLLGNNNIISEVFNGPGNIHNNLELAYSSISQSIDQLIEKNKIDGVKMKAMVGVAGFADFDNRIKLQNMLTNKYPQLDFKIISDCYMAYKSSYPDSDGAILICGTGVVGYSIKRNQESRIGGWGFPQGDIGGGAWIGLEICKLICKAIDNIIPWSLMLESIYKEQFSADKDTFFTWLLSASPKDFGKLVEPFVSYVDCDIYASGILMAGVTELKNIVRIITYNQLPITIFGGLSNLYLPYLQRDFSNLSIAKQSAVFGAIHM